MIWGVTPLGGRWGGWMGMRVGVGIWSGPCKHTCACMHACTHTCTYMINMDASWRWPFAITKYAIKLERIKIIQFCLKIWDPWTLLHTYRLGLMWRWGVSYPKWHFYVFDPKKCSRDPPIKKFPIFALDSIRPYLDWALRGFLTS